MAGKARQRALAREKAQRQMARRSAEARRRHRITVAFYSSLAVVAALAVLGFTLFQVGVLGGSKDTLSAKNASPKQVQPSTALCSYFQPQQGQGGLTARNVGYPPINGVIKKGTVTVSMVTNRGNVQISLDRKNAPCTVNNFISLAEQHYFAKTTCHRLTTKGLYVLQCGDPTGTGRGGPGYVFPDENLPKDVPAGSPAYPRGTLAMANSGPNTNGSQFFLVYKDSSLPPNYSVFGHISKGLGVLDAIAKGGTDNSNGPGDGHPKLAVKISKIKVVSASPEPAEAGKPAPARSPSKSG